MNDAKMEPRPLPPKGTDKPKIGVAKGELVVPDSFFEPLPDEIIEAFGGMRQIASA